MPSTTNQVLLYNLTTPTNAEAEELAQKAFRSLGWTVEVSRIDYNRTMVLNALREDMNRVTQLHHKPENLYLVVLVDEEPVFVSVDDPVHLVRERTESAGSFRSEMDVEEAEVEVVAFQRGHCVPPQDKILDDALMKFFASDGTHPRFGKIAVFVKLESEVHSVDGGCEPGCVEDCTDGGEEAASGNNDRLSFDGRRRTRTLSGSSTPRYRPPLIDLMVITAEGNDFLQILADKLLACRQTPRSITNIMAEIQCEMDSVEEGRLQYSTSFVKDIEVVRMQSFMSLFFKQIKVYMVK